MADVGGNSTDVTDGVTEECSWKSKLSAAFNDEQIFFSLLLLSIFYVGYAAAKADFDDDNTSRFIQSCYCSTHQRSFFRAWFLLFCLIWFIIHTYTFLTQLFVKSWPGCGKIIIRLLTIGSVCLECTCFLLPALYQRMKAQSCNDIIGDPDINQNRLKAPKFPKADLESNIRLLWYQYCRLYVVGYAEDDNMIEFTINQSSQQKDDCACTCPTMCCNQLAHGYLCKGIIRACLFLIKYASQLVAVPLLLLQIFDTYSLLCFSPDLYCSSTSEYKLHLAQSAITLLFYCSLALSQLVSTMLSWNPWPQKRNEKQTIKRPKIPDNSTGIDESNYMNDMVISIN